MKIGSSKYACLLLILLFALGFMVSEGTKGPNRYGPAPKLWPEESSAEDAGEQAGETPPETDREREDARPPETAPGDARPPESGQEI